MKIKLKYYNLLWIILIATLSCQNYRLSPSEYIQYCNDPENKLIAHQVTDSFEYFIQYRTPEYMAIMELDKSNNPAQLKSSIHEYHGLEYYVLKIKHREVSRLEKSNMNYMSFDFQQSIRMVSLDSIRPVLFQFENTQGISPYYTFSIGFDSSLDSLTDRTIRIDHFKNDKPVVFTIPIQTIRNIPKLKI